MWAVVGEQATPRERFIAYFKDVQRGCAIPVKTATRFPKPIGKEALKKIDPAFSVPVSYRLLGAGSGLLKGIQDISAQLLTPVRVSLRRIRPQEKRVYKTIVTDVIAPKYDEISPSFAASVLDADSLGYDPYGIFTDRKEVLTVLSCHGQVIGFTTLTFKKGGSVKTGPTVLFPEQRGKGYGAAVRRAIEKRARAGGARKLYCTCPDNDNVVISYLIDAGYKVEAHLKAHYTGRNGELVFGLMLQNSPTNGGVGGDSTEFAELGISKFAKAQIVKTFAAMFSTSWLPISQRVARAMLGGAFQRPTELQYEKKPSEVVIVGRRGVIDGIALLVPKRGGATKALVLPSETDTRVVRTLVSLVEKKTRDMGRRKLYVLHPITACSAVDTLMSADFEPEGIIRSPYVQGQHAIVLSKLLVP